MSRQLQTVIRHSPSRTRLTSVNQLISTAVAEKVSALRSEDEEIPASSLLELVEEAGWVDNSHPFDRPHCQ